MKSKRLYYGWVVALAGAGIQSSQALVVYTFGIFLRPLTMEFGWERGALSTAFSLAALIMGLFSIVTGRLSDKYGPRILITLSGLLLGAGFLLMTQISSLWQIYLFWGLCMGIAGSCSLIPVISTIPRWFTEKRGIAIAIPATGFGLGAIIAPLLAQWLISDYGWQQSFLILGLIAMVIIIPLAQLMKRSPQQIGLKPYGESEAIEDRPSEDSAEGLSLRQAIKTARFWVFASIQLCWFFCLQTIIVHITPHAADTGASAIVAASILSFIAGSSVISRFSMGFISDKIGSRLALSLCLILATLALAWLYFAREVWTFYVFAIVFGLAYGGIIPLLTVVSSELFGVRFLGVILGALVLCSTVGGAVGAPLAGYIFDTTGDYNLALLLCTIASTLTVVLSLSLLRYRAKKV